jgi:signal transduction histidine kinase
MELILVSANPELRLMCREVLSELAENCSLIVVEPNGVPPAGDVYVWDFQPRHEIPDHIIGQPTWKHLFLVHGKDLSLFRQLDWSPEPAVLLQPITPVTLSAFLGQALAACAGAPSSPVATIRANCDELLQCLIQTNLRLQEYDQERTNFLARAVHDFRAPLTAINGYCGLLIAEPLGSLNEDQKEVLKRMQHSAKRLSRMASAMFQLSIRGQAKAAHPNLESGDLQECIDQAMHEMALSIEEKRIDVSVDLTSPPVPLLFDKSQMEQVLLNLLDNACKFTSKSGAIEIRGYPFFWDRRSLQARMHGATERRIRGAWVPNSYRLDIRDSGPGIPAEHLDSIFEQYTRYSGTQDRTGGGLGLAICKMLLSGHQGRVWAESGESGARFSLVIPFCSTEASEKIENAQYAVV